MMVQKTWNRILNVLIILMAVIIFTAFVGYMCGLRYYIVLSGSMEPAIHTGSLSIINTKAKYEEIEQGDIVAYETTRGIRVTHRVESVAVNGLITKGDANDTDDGISVNKENFMGETIGAIPFAGYILMFFQTKKGMILSVTAIIVLWLLDMMIQCLTSEGKNHYRMPLVKKVGNKYESKKNS